MKYLIGIDPSWSTMGVCIYTIGTHEMVMKTGELMACVDWLNTMPQVLVNSAVIIEDANLNTHFWGTTALQNDIRMYKAGKIGAVEIEQKVRMAIDSAQKVGKQKSAATYLIQLFEAERIPCLTINPSKRTRADKEKNVGKHLFLNMPTKLNAAQFCDITGYDKRSSEHARDAAMLVWKKTETWVRMSIQANAQLAQK